MDEAKRMRLEEAGFRVGDAADFLNLSAEESALVEVRLALAAGVKRNRVRQQLTQAELARRIHSSQSRVARIESGDPSVSLDLIMRALFATGTSVDQVGDVIAAGA